MYDISRQKLACGSCGMKLSPEEYETAAAAKARRESASSSFSSSSSSSSSSASSVLKPKTGEAETASSGTPDYVPCEHCRTLLSRGIRDLLGACPVCHRKIAGAVIPAGTDSAPNSGFAAPDLIVPFSREKEFFIQEFRKHLKSLEFVPDSFLEASIEGVRPFYVPVFLYDAEVSGEISFIGEILTKVLANRTVMYQLEEFEIEAAGRQLYSGSPENLTRDISDYAFRNLEPFDSQGAQLWSRGYAAIPDLTVPDIAITDNFGRAGLRFMTGFEYFLAEGESYTCFRTARQGASVIPLKVSYAWLPVWVMKVKQGGKEMLCHMNGQTGKLEADIPVSNAKTACWLFSGLFLLTGLAAWISAPYFMPIARIPDGFVVGAIGMVILMLLYSVTAPVRRVFSGRLSWRIAGPLTAGSGMAFIIAAYLGNIKYSGTVAMFMLGMLAGGLGVICYSYPRIKKRLAGKPGGNPRNEGVPYAVKSDLRYRNKRKTAERLEYTADTIFKPVE